MSSRLYNLNNVLNQQNRIIQLRNNTKINKIQLFNFVFPSNISKYFDEIYSIILKGGALFQTFPHHQQMNKDQQRQLAAKQSLILLKSLKLNQDKDPYKIVACMQILSIFNFGLTLKTMVSFILYIKTIMIFQTNFYHQKCLQRAYNLQDIGSFCLTELYHGSFSRGIQTTAQYDHKHKQFVLSTHGQKGMKIMNGNTAQFGNRTILWAQLIANGVSYGPHPFIMQLRDDKDHNVLPRLMCGDWGLKSGQNGNDNGYTIIDNVRVPVQALLGKLGSIDENGKYQSKISNNLQRFGYHMSPLSAGRAIFALTSLSFAISSLTIAIRYACIRHQFKTSQNDSYQKLLIDYPSIRYRLLVSLATNIVHYFAVFKLNQLYVENSSLLADTSQKIVSEMHAIAGLIKAKSSWFASEIITQCRQVLGGHGYSLFSKLGTYYHENDPNTTGEGDNYLLLQQTSKYLLKIFGTKTQQSKGEIVSLSFVDERMEGFEMNQSNLQYLKNLRILLQKTFLFQCQIAIKQLQKIRKQIKQQNKSSQQSEFIIWNKFQPYFANQMAMIYGDLVYFEIMAQSLEKYSGSSYNKQFLEICLITWTQKVLLKYSVQNKEVRNMLQVLIIKNCDKIYPQCISVTDTLCAPAKIIGSPFAQQNGQGMKQYLNLVFESKNAFRRVPWFHRLIQLRQK